MICPKCNQEVTYNPEKTKWVPCVVRNDDWRPPTGMEPTLREYHCSGCKQTFYMTRGLPKKDNGEQTDFMALVK